MANSLETLLEKALDSRSEHSGADLHGFLDRLCDLLDE
jgi:hypothetical protein